MPIHKTLLLKNLMAALNAEMEAYRAWLLQQQPETILSAAYRYTHYESIIECVSNSTLTLDGLQALNADPHPLSTLYDHWLKADTGNDDLAWNIRDCANDLAAKARTNTTKA